MENTTNTSKMNSFAVKLAHLFNDALELDFCAIQPVSRRQFV